LRSDDDDDDDSVEFFMYLRAEHNDQWPITELAQIKITTIRQTKDNAKKGEN
jgi:hypothetical protein